MQSVYLICGVPGSGKTWVCNQLTNKFNYIPHDDHLKDHEFVISKEVFNSPKPIITESPFAERVCREKLESIGIKVIPYFVIEEPNIVKSRYEKRENKPVSQNVLTRAVTIKNRALEWNAPFGTSTEILNLLKNNA